MSVLERNNKTAMVSHFVIAGVMQLFCILQTLQGGKTPLYLLVMLVLGLGPVLAEFMFWKKNHETGAIKHLVAMGFAVFYTVALFTATSNMVYAFVIPMILVVTLYQDVKYFIMINVGTILESVLIVTLGAKTGGYGYLGLDAGIIQVVVMILVGVVSIYTSSTNRKNEEQTVETISASQMQAEKALQSVSEMTKGLKESIAGVYEEVEKLKESSRHTGEAMEQVSTGAQDSAMAVQNQTAQTEAIQTKVGSVDEAAAVISDNMQRNLEVLELGRQDMKELLRQVEGSVQNSEDAAAKLERLDANMKEMNSIVEIISGITSKTSLLALNASIEAARAGEAGKGFAVVATEISTMATQTKEATVHITEMIDNISEAIEEVVQVIRLMMEGIAEEKVGAEDAANSFREIRKSTYAIRDNVEAMVKNVAELKGANQEIVDSIQTISAISEEVSAHANETLEAEEENSRILDNITEMMEEMKALSRE